MTKINKIKKHKEKSVNSKTGSLEKKIGKPPVRLITENKKEKNKYPNIKNERGSILQVLQIFTDINRKILLYDEEL